MRTDARGGPAAVAIGADENTAVAWVTVATSYVPSKLLVSVRPPGGTFGVPFELAPGTAVGNFDLGITAAGSVHAVWQDASGIEARVGFGVTRLSTASALVVALGGGGSPSASSRASLTKRRP